MYTRQQLNDYTRDELRQIVRDNKINCVPTKMSKDQLIDTLLSCQKGKLKCPSSSYVKIPDEFQGEVGCDKSQDLEINIEKKPKKKKVVKDSSSSSPKKSPKKSLNIENLVKSAILSYDGDIKEINTTGDLKKLLSKYGLSEDDFDENKSEIKTLSKVYIKQKKESQKAKPKLDLENLVKSAILSYDRDIKEINTTGDLKKLLAKYGLSEDDFEENKSEIKSFAKVYIKQKKEMQKEEEEESSDEEEEEEEDIEDDLENSVKDFILNFEGKVSELTVTLLKKNLKNKFNDEQLKNNTDLIKKFIGIYGRQLKENRKKKAPSPKVSPKPSPKKAPSPKVSPKPSPKKSPSPKVLPKESKITEKLKNRLRQKGIVKDLPLDDEELLELLEADRCDPDEGKFCGVGQACHVDNKVCLNDKGSSFDKSMNRTVINDNIFVGSDELIQRLKNKLSRKVSPVVSPRKVSPVVSPRQAQVEEEMPSEYEEVEEESDVDEEDESDVESLADDEELFKERKQYQRFSDISKALNECIMQTILRV